MLIVEKNGPMAAYKMEQFFPIKWHIVMDIPNTLRRHIFLQDNNSSHVTYKKDTRYVLFLTIWFLPIS